MPRKRKAFIERARAQTYQVVYTPLQKGASEPALIPLDQQPSAPPTLPADTPTPFSALETEYTPAQYELGEFGFPDDGYDYSKHFMPIGGGGGVYMDAASGLAQPEAVSSLAAAAAQKVSFALREDVQENEEQRFGPPKSWHDQSDNLLKQNAISQIKRDRRKDNDLDEIFAALDSEGELEDPETDLETDLETDHDTQLDPSDQDDPPDLDDDFVQLADMYLPDQHPQPHHDLLANVDLPSEPPRPQRLLDDQFDLLMQQYDADESDSFDNAFQDDESDTDLEHPDVDFAAHLTQDELANFLTDDGVVDALSSLQIDQVEETQESLSDIPDLSSDPLADRAAEMEKFTNAEFQQGMDRLLDMYNRVPATEALDAIEGVDGARAAIARNEVVEREELQLKDELGVESDGHDSELDTKYNEMYTKEERWDCETILSTYTNLDNHPSVIDAPAGHKKRSNKQQPIIRLDPRTQAPEGFVVGATGRSDAPAVDYGTRREIGDNSRRGESKEEKKLRKAAVKEAARERRALKSEMRKAFGEENVRQSKHAASIGTSKVAVQF